MARSDAYTSTGLQRFLDRIMNHGLEALGLYYSTYRAIVVDNVDDTDQGKLVIRCPAVGDVTDTRRTAYPIAPGAGSQFGVRFIPPVGSQVYVEFENGRVDMPLWKGAWWGKDQLPSDWRGNPQAHGWFTPAGHQILIDDKSDQQRVRILHVSGSEIVMDNNGGISIRNKSGQKVNVGLNASEAAVLGDTLKSLLEETLDAVQQLTVPTAVGPSGPPTNAPLFASVKARLRTALSQTVLVK